MPSGSLNQTILARPGAMSSTSHRRQIREEFSNVLSRTLALGPANFTSIGSAISKPPSFNRPCTALRDLYYLSPDGSVVGSGIIFRGKRLWLHEHSHIEHAQPYVIAFAEDVGVLNVPAEWIRPE